MKKWKCTLCGYVHTGAEPPEKCPVCGADKSLFVLMEEETVARADADETHVSDEPSDTFSRENTAPSARGDAHQAEDRKEQVPTDEPSQPAWKRFAASVYGQYLTRYHGHPIAVHIPNGVLPLAALFAILAVIFKSQALAVAAQYDIGFVALTMPLVIGTGFVDWSNGYKARMTRIFKTKMICAAIVILLSLVLALWGGFGFGIYSSSISESWFFLLLHLANLGAAGVAGWYGGKLVYRK